MLAATSVSMAQPVGTCSVMVQEAPTGSPGTVTDPFDAVGASIALSNTPSDPQSTTMSNEPDTGTALPLEIALVITRSAVWWVSVNAAVTCWPPTIVSGPVGDAVSAQPTWSVSVTLHDTPAGMSVMAVDRPPPPVVVIARATSQAVPSQSTTKSKVPSPPTADLSMINEPV